jgi:hypothetical protein
VLTEELRGALDGAGLGTVLLYRPLYLHSRLLSPRLGVGAALAARLVESPADALWLAVHPFGTGAGPLAVRRYIDFTRALHGAGLPLVGLHTGTIGVLLMALGVLSGIESGVTDGERFDVDAITGYLRVPRPGEKVIGSTPRIYLQTLKAFVTTTEADTFFGVRGMAAVHACQPPCCAHGTRDMAANRISHFTLPRQAEIDSLERIPPHRRARAWLDDQLRPASDRAIAAERALPRLASVRRRLDDWRRITSAMIDKHTTSPPSIAPPLTGHRRNITTGRAGEQL